LTPGGVAAVERPYGFRRGLGRLARPARELACKAPEMSLIAASRLLRRARRHLLVAAALLVTSGAVAAHHGMPMDMHAIPAGAMCLAVLGGVAAAAGYALLRTAPRVLPAPSACWATHEAPIRRPRSVPARAGPLIVRLQVLRR
jgi:hypothetical protein